MLTAKKKGMQPGCAHTRGQSHAVYSPYHPHPHPNLPQLQDVDRMADQIFGMSTTTTTIEAANKTHHVGSTTVTECATTSTLKIARTGDPASSFTRAPDASNQVITPVSAPTTPVHHGALKALKGKALPETIENQHVNILRFKELLNTHPDRHKVDSVINGLKFGFDIGFRGVFTVTAPKNNSSAMKNSGAVSEAVYKEIQRGHTAGPFSKPPFTHNHISPIGAVSKPDGSARLIMDLSQPHGKSINEFISKDEYPTNYVHFDLATDLVYTMGRGCLLSKVDIKHAYRLLPVRPQDWPLLVYCWEGLYFVDLKLPFGSRSSSSIFTSFADLVCWILTTKVKLVIIHYSDDYLLVSVADMVRAKNDLRDLLATFDYLEIPVATDKLIGPATEVVYLGITINTNTFIISIPDDKIDEVLSVLPKWCSRRTCKKSELLSLLGKLNFFATVVRAGRLFVRRLIDLSTTVKQNHHHVTLNSEARSDIHWWCEFLPKWNRCSIVPNPLKIRSSDIKLFTDAAKTIGLGAIYGNAWIQAKWPKDFVDLDIDFKELFAIFAAVITWGKQWAGRRVVVVTDNKPITQIWDSGSTPAPKLMSLVRRLFLFAANNNFSMSFKHILGHYNEVADALSRFQVDRFKSLAPLADPHPTAIPPDVWVLGNHLERHTQLNNSLSSPSS